MFALALFLRNFLEHEAPVGVGVIHLKTERINEHELRIGAGTNPDALLHTGFVDVFRGQPPESLATINSMLCGAVVGVICLTLRLNLPDQAPKDVRRLGMSHVVGRQNLSRWPILSDFVDDLTTVLSSDIYGQADFLIASTSSERAFRPLPHVI